MNHSISRKGPSSHGSSLNFKSYAEKQQSYVERYKDAFKEESATLEFNQLFKSNQYLRECLKDLNSLMSKKIDKQKEKIFTHYKKEEHSPKKTSSQLIEEQLTLLERDYKNNNFIFSQQERELKQLDERLQGRSSNIHFELVGEIEQLNDEIRQMRNQCNTQKQYNFMEGKYLDINSQIPRNVVVQQNTALDALKLQRENERIKDLTKKKEELMKEFAKKIQNVDKKFNIANSKQFEEVNESLAKKIAEEKRKTESLELKIDIIIKSYEREQLKHKQIQKDVSLIEKHTDDKVNALELQIRQLNADMQQIQELGQEVDQNQKQERISQSDFKLTQQEEGNEQSKYRGITPLKPIKSDNKLDQSKSMNPMMKKKVIGKISLNKSNLELLQISSKDLKPKVDVHSVSIQQTPTDQKQQQEQQPYFSASNKLKQQQSQEKDSINHNNDDSQFEGNNPKNEQQNLDDSAVFNPKHNQNKTNKRSSQQNFQMERNNKENKQKYEQDDGDDYDNIDNIQAEIKNLQEEEEEEQAVKAGNDHKEQMKQKPKVNSGKNLSQDSHTGMEQQGNNHINIPNKPIESIYDLEESNNHESKSNQQKQRLISKLNSNEQIQNQSKVSQHNIKNSNDNLQNDSKNELKSQIFYNEPTGIQALNQSIKVDQLNNIKRSSNPSILPVIKNNNNNNNNNNVPLKSDAGFNKQNYQNMNKDNSIDSNSNNNNNNNNNNNINNQLNKKHENNNTQQEGSKKQIQNQVNTKQGSSQQQNEKKKENEGKDVWEELSDL